MRLTMLSPPHIVFWGAAIVIFLVKIINLHNDDLQGFWVEVSSQVTNGTRQGTTTPVLTLHVSRTGLFTVTGIGLIPSRVLDTYRAWIFCDTTRLC